ncbi:MAG: hypothetical protein H6978_06085 [Gammaproteobacteria bacterium]|nr:hypothetical protein [Gammaproteobacteria bacterium]
MQKIFNRNFRGMIATVATASVLVLQPAFAADKKEAEPGGYDAATGKLLNEAIEMLNMDNYSGAKAKIGTMNFEKLSPYERSHVEQVLASIEHHQENYGAARNHLLEGIKAGGFNEQELSDIRYQIAQLYLTEEKWKEGAAALEEWFRNTSSPNSAAYYLLAVAYYQMEDFNKALPNAQKAVDLSEKPQESWIQLVLALYLQKDQFKPAIPLLERLISMVPDKKTYWMQLSSVYGQVEDYPKALAVMQLAYDAGLTSDDAEIRRLADLLMFNDVPYRGATVLEKAIDNKTVTVDAKLYEKLANCWIAAREYDKSINPLQRAAQMSSDGELFIRLGEVQIQREDWNGAAQAIESGLNKGGIKNQANAHVLLGVAYYNMKEYRKARPWFERATGSSQFGKMAKGYLQMIAANS